MKHFILLLLMLSLLSACTTHKINKEVSTDPVIIASQPDSISSDSTLDSSNVDCDTTKLLLDETPAP